MSTFHPAALFVCAKSLSMQISDMADLVFYFTSGALEITQNDCRRGVQVNTLESSSYVADTFLIVYKL